MFNRRSKLREAPKADYWVSYSDLMAGLLMVFILLLFSVLLLNKREVESREAEMDARDMELTEQREQLASARGDLVDLRTNVAELLGVRAALLLRLTERFEEVGGDISFDDATGAVRLGSDILFDEGEYDLTSDGEDALREFVPIYVDALLGDTELRLSVDRITFEGHTNSNYYAGGSAADGYLYNLNLSQQRAQAAVEFVIEEELMPYEEARQLLSAVGYSSARPILADGVEDLDASRRLEIRFRLRDEEALDRLRQLLAEGGLD